MSQVHQSFCFCLFAALPRFICLICLSVTMLGFSGLKAAEPEPKAEAEAALELKAGTAYVYLRGNFPLRPSVGLFEKPALSRAEAQALLQKTFATQHTQVVIDCSAGAMLSATSAESFAALIRKHKLNGQTVSCVVDGASDADLILAAACDEVICINASFHNVDGVALYMDYYADALAKIGVHFNAVTSGPEKTAPEFITHSKPSPAAIAESEKLMQAVDDNLLLQSQRQALDAVKIKAARELAPQSSEVLVSSGLADKVVELGAWQAQLPLPLNVQRHGTKQQDLSSFSGMMTFWSQLMSGPKDTSPKAFIAVLELEGSIVDGDSAESGLISTTDTVREIQDLEKDERVKAVLVRMNSGGGSATASDRIYHALKALAAAKPCVVLIDDVAASGGYYIACAAPYIMAHHGSITGSIGVFAVMPDLSEMRSMLGVHRHVLATSSRATVYSTDAFDDAKRAAIQTLITDIDRRFQSIVATERHLDPAKVAKLANGKVYLAAEALGAGLIDATGGYDDALAYVQAKAGVTDLPTLRFPKQKGLAEMLGLDMGVSMQASALSATLGQVLSLGLPVEIRHLLTQLRGMSEAPGALPMVFCWRQIPTIH